MGLYNYLGEHQVKCFYLANVIIDSLDNLSIYSIGGTLRQYEKGNEVPYKTLYYNYGKDFLIYDTRGISLNEEVIIHIIKDGKYFDTVEYSNLTKNMFVNNVVDVYGDKININIFEDIVDYYNAVVRREKDYIEYTKKYEKEANVNKNFYHDYKEQRISKEDFYTELEKQKNISDRVHNEINVPFNNRWRVKDTDLEDGTIIGHLLDCYTNLDKNIYEWNCIFDKFICYLKNENQDFMTLVSSYKEWCKLNDIIIDINKLEEMISLIEKRGVNF